MKSVDVETTDKDGRSYDVMRHRQFGRRFPSPLHSKVRLTSDV